MLASANRKKGTCARLTALAATLGLLLLGCTDDRDSETTGGGGPGGDDGTSDGGVPTGDDGGDDGGDTTGDGDGSTSDDGGDDGSTGDPGPDVGDGGGDGGGQPDISDCSYFADVQAFFEEMNTQRGSYGGEPPYLPHDRWKGIPWEGEYHNNWTFPVRFTWDDGLAAQALEEAQRLADGGAPAGTQVAGQNGCCRDFWIDGLNTADWRLTAAEYPGDYDDPYNSTAAFTPGNGSARMGLFYHDFGGDGPAINRMGVGAVSTASCEVWWVMQFGP